MSFSKYIIVKEKGHEVAVLFDPLIPHNEIRKSAISAGFFCVEASSSIRIKVSVFGESISLKLQTRPEDATLIEKMLLGL